MNERLVGGLSRQYCVRVERRRLLPVGGDVRVKTGQPVAASEVIAEAVQQGELMAVNVARSLGISPDEVPGVMLKQPGQTVLAGEIIARKRGLLGLGQATLRSPGAGELTEVSRRTGLVTLRGEPQSLSVRAHISGEIVQIIPERGAVIRCECTLLQGIFGIGGEQTGELVLCAGSPEAVVTAEDIEPRMREKVVVGGALITGEALRRARELGVAALVTGGIHAADLEAFLGYDVRVAITGHEDVGLTVIVTGGFGRIPLDTSLQRLLGAREGALASVSGATQIRAGAVRPEILVPWSPDETPVAEQSWEVREAAPLVRIVCEPFFGALAEVIAWPPEPRQMPSGVCAAAVVLRLADGQEICLPRANIESLGGKGTRG